jgi:hypothetical protein
MINGVAAVITMVALAGAQSSIDAQIQTMGTNTIQVQAGNFTQGAFGRGRVMPARRLPTTPPRFQVQGALYRRLPADARPDGGRQSELEHAD